MFLLSWSKRNVHVTKLWLVGYSKMSGMRFNLLLESNSLRSAKVVLHTESRMSTQLFCIPLNTR